MSYETTSIGFDKRSAEIFSASSVLISIKGKIALGIILAAALVLQVIHARQWGQGYDEAWNLFYAKVQPFSASLVELKHNAHPPLASFLLRIPIVLGDGIFWARFGSIVPAVLSILFIFLILKKLIPRSPLPYIFALIPALSHSVINMATCVRAYTLMTLFLVIALYFFVDILNDISRARPGRIFACVVFTQLAVWTEYCAAFAVMAILAAFGGVLLSNRKEARMFARGLIKAWPAVLLLIGSAAGIVVYFRSTIMPVWQGHVATHYIGDTESVIAFAARGIASNLGYFTPIRISTGLSLGMIAGGFLIAAGLLFFHYRKVGRNPAVACLLLAHPLLWMILLTTGVLKLYPFGGSMRHQFVLYPFLLITLAVFAHAALSRLRDERIRSAFAGLLSAGIIWHAAATGFHAPSLEEFPGAPLFQAEYTGFIGKLQPEDVIYLTHFNQFAFFYHTLDWRWEYQGKTANQCYIYQLSKNTERRQVIVDRWVWLPPIPFSNAFLDRLREVIQARHIKGIWVFSAIQGDLFAQQFDGQALKIAAETSGIETGVAEPYQLGNGYAVKFSRPEQE